MAELKSFVGDIYYFFRNIFVSFYNFLNHYVSSEILLGIGIVLAAFIICVLFKKITER